VILRLYGGKLIDKHMNSALINSGITDEVIVFYAMSELGYGPKLYGVFDGGRIEQFIECRLFNNDDYLNPDAIAGFARRLAQMHVLNLPMNRRHPEHETKIVKVLESFKPSLKDAIRDIETKPEFETDKSKILNFNFEDEIKWITSARPKILTRQVLCHGDLNRANCLVRDEIEDSMEKLMLIDFEFSNYGRRGADISKHFSSRTYDTAKPADKFKSGLEYPSRAEREHFAKAYSNYISSHYDDYDPIGIDSVNSLLSDAIFCGLASNLLAVINSFRDPSFHTKLGFDVFNRAAEGLGTYVEGKAELLEMNPSLIDV